MRTRTWLSVAAVLVTGCSALVDPDGSELGGPATAVDAGPPDGDGMRPHVDGGDTNDGGSVHDGSPACPGGCDDGIPCTEDRCVDGRCDSAPRDSRCDDDERCNPARGCVPQRCRNHLDCDDGLHCNGREVCEPASPDADPSSGCVAGTAPDCDDGLPCTVDECDDAAMMCTHTLREECRPPPDDCEAAAPVELSDGTATVTGSFERLTDSHGSSCGGYGNPDAIYFVDLAEPSDVTVDTIGSEADTLVAVSGTCGSFSLACDNDIAPGREAASRVWMHNVGPAPGAERLRLYILVDSVDEETSADFTLNVSVRAAKADRCADPIDISGGGTLAGVVGSISARTGSCALASVGAESVATFTAPDDGTAQLDTFSRDFAPTVHVREQPCSLLASELYCENARSIGGGWNRTTLELELEAGEPHFLFVDGATRGDRYVTSYNP